MALTVSKHIEVTAGLSTRAFISKCKKITNARLIDQINNEEMGMRIPVTKDLKKSMPNLLYRTNSDKSGKVTCLPQEKTPKVSDDQINSGVMPFPFQQASPPAGKTFGV